MGWMAFVALVRNLILSAVVEVVCPEEEAVLLGKYATRWWSIQFDYLTPQFSVYFLPSLGWHS